MTSIRLLLACGLVFVPGLSGRADAQATKLPDDGWWIRYFSTTKQEGNGQVQEFTTLTTYSLVGTVVEDGEKLRWVEMHSVSSIGDRKHSILWKYLIPEKDLIENEQPLDKLKRGWVKVNELEVRAIALEKARPAGRAHLAIFPGIWQKSEPVESQRIVDYQKGRLTIPQARTRLESRAIANRRGTVRSGMEMVTKNEYIAWFDPATAPVLTAVKIHGKTFQGDVQRLSREDDMVMEDTGSDAKSQLPDHH